VFAFFLRCGLWVCILTRMNWRRAVSTLRRLCILLVRLHFLLTAEIAETAEMKESVGASDEVLRGRGGYVRIWRCYMVPL
jgi:hypothetical protein